MKKVVARMLCGFLGIVTAIGVGVTSPPGDIQAASKSAQNKKALKAYNKELRTTDVSVLSNSEFALIDINKDGIKELLTTNDDAYHIGIHAYVKGKVKLVEEGFSGDEYFYPNKSMFFLSTYHSGDWIEHYYKFNGKKATLIAASEGHDFIGDDGLADVKYTYKIKGKVSSKKKFRSYVKKLKKGAKKAKIKWVKNTAKNRKKYLKVSSSAAKTPTKVLAEEAYSSYVSTMDVNYAFVDIDKNGVPELLIKDNGLGESIFTYSKGNIISVEYGEDIQNFGGNPTITCYPKVKIVYVYTLSSGGSRGEYYKFDGKSLKNLTTVIHSKSGNETYDKTYYIGSKEVSKNKYNSYVKKLVSGTKKASIKWN